MAHTDDGGIGRRRQPHICMPLLRIILSILLLGTAAMAASADEFLPPDEAFHFAARALDERTVAIDFEIADGYYLYRERFAFASDTPGVTLGAPAIPPGKVKFDETFGKDVETYRKHVTIKLPVQAAPQVFTLRVTSQGCADQGLCYPPQPRLAQVRLVGFGGDGSVRVLPPGDAADAGAAAAPPAPSATSDKPSMPTPAAAAVTSGEAQNPTPAQQARPSTGERADAAFEGGSGEAGIDAALRGGRFWAVVGVFFVAGLLLALTPCVLPMLPILSSIIVGQGQATSRARGLGLAAIYSLGMALVYTALGIAAGLAGEGLAAALQNPWVLGAFAALLALLALSMFGAFELQLPLALRSRLDTASGRLQGGHAAGVFAMGGLSALIVSPCVAAPLAGALLYISQTRDVALGGTALFCLAAGISVPLLLVGASAGTLLPRAGAWMESVKRGFGLLLLAVAWWTLAPVLPAAITLAGWGLLLLAAATFLHAFDRLPQGAGAARRLGKALGLALAIGGAAQIVGATAGATDPLRPLARFATAGPATIGAPSVALASAPGTGSAVARAANDAGGVGFQRIASLDELQARLKSTQRPVMLDFYADWCVSCKEMERYTFSDPAVRARLEGALLLQADVTRNTEADRALLKRFKLFGPPGIVFFDARGEELPAVRVIGYQDPARFTRSLQAAGL